MKKEQELSQAILNMTMFIKSRYPELTKYLNEMPIKIVYSPGSEYSRSALKDYYSSLEALLERYKITHTDAPR